MIPIARATRVHAAGEGNGDDDQRHQVVDDGHGEDEGAQAGGVARPDEREHPQRERGVGGHRRAPGAVRSPARVDRQEDGDRDDHPAQPGHDRQHQPAAVAQVAEVELAARLQADDEEEQRHEPVVDPVAQVLGDLGAADAHAQRHVPDACCRTRRRR